MPSLKHQAITQVLRDHPRLVALLLGQFGINVPPDVNPVIADSDLSLRDPGTLKELRADNVFLFKGNSGQFAVVVEVQTGSLTRKRRLAWMCYTASAWQVHDCKAYILVLATTQQAVRSSERLTEIGQPGFNFLPFVTGHRRLPPMAAMPFGPGLVMLHVLTSTLDLSNHEARMLALAAIAWAPEEQSQRYAHLIRLFTPKHVRKAVEDLMQTVFKDSFIDRYIAQGIEQGIEQGKQQGRTEGGAHMLLTLLAACGLAVLDDTRTRINSCTDVRQLEKWATRAITATTTDEIFAP
jgi:hypothetical protein